MSAVVARDTVTITLPPDECQQLALLADRMLEGDPAAESLLQQLREAASLASWLRDRVRLEVTLVDAAMLRDLRHAARTPPVEPDVLKAFPCA